MILDGKKITDDSTFYYVGQTRNYIFWYNAREKSPIIYPIDKLQEFTLKTIDVEKEFESESNTPCDSLANTQMKKAPKKL